MSNTSDEMANRGSKLCMQICVNNTTDDRDKHGNIARLSRKHLLDKKIGLGSINWLTPLAEKSFREYDLRNLSNEDLRKIGLDTMDWSFWPDIQPQWDAIGIAPNDTLILVEAKSHTEELETEWSASNERSKKLIRNSISELFPNNTEKWLNRYYQFANRLVFLDRILKHYHGTERNAYMVFLYFIDDVSLVGTRYNQASKVEWEHYLMENLFDGFDKSLASMRNVKDVFLDVWKDKGVDDLE